MSEAGVSSAASASSATRSEPAPATRTDPSPTQNTEIGAAADKVKPAEVQNTANVVTAGDRFEGTTPDPNAVVAGAATTNTVTPVNATTTPAGPPPLTITDDQFGQKIGKHARDFGLDPSNPEHRQQMRSTIERIAANPDEVRQGPWRGAGNDPHTFYRSGNDVVVAKGNGQFVTVLRDGVNNGFFRGAAPIAAETAGVLSRAAPVLRGVGRAALPVGVALDAYQIATSENPGRTAVEKAGAWTTSLGAAAVAAQAGSPLLAGGPFGWLGYGGLVLGAGAAGYFGGEAATSKIIDWFGGR